MCNDFNTHMVYAKFENDNAQMDDTYLYMIPFVAMMRRGDNLQILLE